MSTNTPLEANEDFATSINFYGEIGYILKQSKTEFNTPAVIVFSQNTIAHKLDVSLIVHCNNASHYLQEHPEEAVNSKYIIVFPVMEENITPELEMLLVKDKYNRMLAQLFKMYDLVSLTSEANRVDRSFWNKIQKFISSIFVTFEHAVIQTRSRQ